MGKYQWFDEFLIMNNPGNPLNVKNAVKIALNYVKELYEDNNLQDLMLEEVDFSEAANQWLITVGFSLPENQEETQPLIAPSKNRQTLSRRYKIVNVNAKTGSIDTGSPFSWRRTELTEVGVRGDSCSYNCA